jgi:hypothetical protein
MLGTFAQATTGLLVAESALSGTVAVAIGALVVVVAIVLVFVMVLRSNGGPRKTASGLGYDAQVGPRGQPQGDPNGPWQRQGGQGPWQQGDDFGMGAPAAGRGGNSGGGGWNQPQEYPVGTGGQQAGGQSPWGAPPSQSGGWGEPVQNAGGGGWGAPASAPGGEQWPPQSGGWNAPPAAAGGAGMGQAQAPAQGGWDMPAPAQGPVPGARGGFGQANAPAAPVWDQPSGGNQPWGGPAAQPQHEWSPPAGNQPAPANAGGWGAPAAGAPAAGAFDSFGDAEKTRVVRPGSATQRPGMIVVRQGKEPGRIFEMRKERLTIGRSRESDIFLEDLAVSRLHTTINQEADGRFVLRDEGSANGTYVNSQKVSEHVLEEGDEIQVGQTVLAFVRR